MKSNRNYLKIIIPLVVIGTMVWSFSSLFSGSGPSENEKRKIIETGTKAVAILMSAERTGNIVNNIHQYEFHFKVESISGKSIEYSEKKLIDPLYMSSIKMRMEIPAYVSIDGEKILILWEEVGIKDAF